MPFFPQAPETGVICAARRKASACFSEQFKELTAAEILAAEEQGACPEK